jgi:radical SAM superfamily enzyme with C-terminal helix-hairpin-helix motif
MFARYLYATRALVHVLNTAHSVRGAHVCYEHHVVVDVLVTIMEVIRGANRTGGCCTSTEVHHMHITVRALRSVMSSMNYSYDRGNIIGEMNDTWYIAKMLSS